MFCIINKRPFRCSIRRGYLFLDKSNWRAVKVNCEDGFYKEFVVEKKKYPWDIKLEDVI